MEKLEFTKNFAEQFEDLDQSAITIETSFRDIEGYSSLVALSIIAMVDEEYNVKIKGDDIRKSKTVEDLYLIVKSRI